MYEQLQNTYYNLAAWAGSHPVAIISAPFIFIASYAMGSAFRRTGLAVMLASATFGTLFPMAVDALNGQSVNVLEGFVGNSPLFAATALGGLAGIVKPYKFATEQQAASNEQATLDNFIE